MSTNTGKDVIYVDVDDEITSVIDKVATSPERIVALVLPKRAAVFQSVVNMKLLKRRADAAKKHIVLITSEAGLMPLAGNVGLHVAKTLQSKPEIPEITSVGDAAEDADEAMDVPGDEFDAGKEGTTPVGKLANGMPKNPLMQMPEETLDLDNTNTPSGPTNGEGKNVAAMAAAGASGRGAKAAKKNKKLRVPNFNRFRLLIILGIIALIVLIFGWFLAFKVLPKAVITIKTNTSDVNSSLDLTLDTNAHSIKGDSGVVPAQTQQQQKTLTQQANATGKKNKGSKASGSITMTAKKCGGNPFNTPDDVPAGTGVSANGLTYITQGTVKFSGSGTSGNCFTYSGSSDVSIAAQKPGAQYNVSDGTDFSVAGRSDVSASGSADGGTDDIVQILQQSDIDSAKQKLQSSQNTDDIKQQLKDSLEGNNLYPIEATFNQGSPNISATAKAGDQTSSVTVTETITYTMFGAKKSDLKKVLDANVNKQIDPNKQSIQDDGLDGASFNAPNKGTATQIQVSVQATATVGPHVDIDKLKDEVAGKKSGDVRSIIKANPGVTDVDVAYSPFWVTKAPGASKITVQFEKPSHK